MSSPEEYIAHRPWPLPKTPWVMFQSWRELLFAHWPLPRETLRAHVPSQLEIEEFDGSAWLGLTPFRLTGLRTRFFPSLPGVSEFPEMNLRTYVRVADKPGIFFFSLDAANSLAVLGARIGYSLPYFPARMSIAREDGWIRYRSARVGGAAEFVGEYRPLGDVFTARSGTLEYFLTERYALYAVTHSGRVIRGDIHHAPWSLQTAEATIQRNTVAATAGIIVPEVAPLLHYSARQDTLVWPPKRLA